MTDPHPVICYDDMVFDRKCPKCGRFVKPPKRITFKKNWATEMIKDLKCIAQCSRCGDVNLVFEGYFN